MLRPSLNLILIALICQSCYRHVESCISINSRKFSVGEEIEFRSCDTWGEQEILWEFGDGWESEDEFARHIYTSPGVYTVKLTVKDGRSEDSSTETVRIGEYVLKMAEINFVDDQIAYRDKKCHQLYILSNNRLLASSFGDSCYSELEYLRKNFATNDRIGVPVKPQLRIIHSYLISTDSNQPFQYMPMVDTLILDSNTTINLKEQIVYDNVLFFGKNEVMSADFTFPLHLPSE